MNNSIPRGLQSLLTKLNFLSQITRGFKPCMSNMTFVDCNSWFGAFQRNWNGESRKSLIAAIEQIVGETTESINSHYDNDFLLRLIINALPEARLGVESLKITYREDPEIISRVSVQLTNIDLQLERFRDLIKGYEFNIKNTNEDSEILEDVLDFVKSNDNIKHNEHNEHNVDDNYLDNNVNIPPQQLRRRKKMVRKIEG